MEGSDMAEARAVTEHGSRIIAALERERAAIQAPASRDARHRDLFIAGELMSAGGRAVLEVMLHQGAHALATLRGVKDTSTEGNR
jgi:hypothetical protein